MRTKTVVEQTALAPQNGGTDLGTIERVIAAGDLSRLQPDERARYYAKVCESLGLNPYTQPFQYITLNGKLTLYATRAATDQLRALRRVSLVIVDRGLVGELYVVTARATLPDGRTDEEIGAVPVKGLAGEALANAMMKASTKAKRRVTLSVCGLGWLDESEVGSIPGATPVPHDAAHAAPVAPAPAAEPEPEPEPSGFAEPEDDDGAPLPFEAERDDELWRRVVKAYEACREVGLRVELPRRDQPEEVLEAWIQAQRRAYRATRG